MAFNDIESQRCDRALAVFIARRRPPPHIRPELDLGYRIAGQSVEIFEVRPVWRNPEEKISEGRRSR